MEQQGAAKLPSTNRCIVRRMARFAPNPAVLSPAKPTRKKDSKSLRQSGKRSGVNNVMRNVIKPSRAASQSILENPMRSDLPRTDTNVQMDSGTSTSGSLVVGDFEAIDLSEPRPSLPIELLTRKDQQFDGGGVEEEKSQLLPFNRQISCSTSSSVSRGSDAELKEESESDSDDEEDSDHLRLTDHHRQLIHQRRVEVIGKGSCSVLDANKRVQWGYFVLVLEENDSKVIKHPYFLPQDRIPEECLIKFRELVLGWM